MVFLPVSLAFVEGMVARLRVENCDYIPISSTGLAPGMVLADIVGLPKSPPQAHKRHRAPPWRPAPKQQHRTVRPREASQSRRRSTLEFQKFQFARACARASFNA